MGESATRQKITEAADLLFYQQGFENTSFADIANVVQISRGNFYHHFKSKDEILDAVIQHRLAATEQMLAQWGVEGESPRGRIKSFIHILIKNRTKIMAYGCPVGTLSTELVKLDHAAQADAIGLFTLFRSWLAEQFIQLGANKAHADKLGMHLLARSQGVATMANAFNDEKFIRHEVKLMGDWVDTSVVPLSGK